MLFIDSFIERLLYTLYAFPGFSDLSSQEHDFVASFSFYFSGDVLRVLGTGSLSKSRSSMSRVFSLLQIHSTICVKKLQL